MSRIEVTVGTASVEIRTDDYESIRGTLTSPYNPYDLINATIKALRAIDTEDATDLAYSIEAMRLAKAAR